jgi:protein tyrosine phosphatase (PTP) superfamily phosphohydrolase (DUF442 family)
MPTAAQLTDVSDAGVELVINLAMPTSENALPKEAALVGSLGMKYVAIPVEWDHPTRADLDKFMDSMDAHAASKKLVHCQANYRASAFIALHRVLRLGWDPEDARRDLRRIWNPEEYPVWKAFIDQGMESPTP